MVVGYYDQLDVWKRQVCRAQPCADDRAASPDQPDVFFTCTLDLQFNHLPDLTGMDEVFQAGRAWSMYTDSDCHWIVRKPPPDGNPEPVWVAEIEPGFAHGTVYCSDRLRVMIDDRAAFKNPV